MNKYTNEYSLEERVEIRNNKKKADIGLINKSLVGDQMMVEEILDLKYDLELMKGATYGCDEDKQKEIKRVENKILKIKRQLIKIKKMVITNI